MKPFVSWPWTTTRAGVKDGIFNGFNFICRFGVAPFGVSRVAAGFWRFGVGVRRFGVEDERRRFLIVVDIGAIFTMSLSTCRIVAGVVRNCLVETSLGVDLAALESFGRLMTLEEELEVEFGVLFILLFFDFFFGGVFRTFPIVIKTSL